MEDFTIELSTCFLSLKGNLPDFLYENIDTSFPEIPDMFLGMVKEKLGRELSIEESNFVKSTVNVFSGYPGQTISSILEQMIYWKSLNPEKFNLEN